MIRNIDSKLSFATSFSKHLFMLYWPETSEPQLETWLRIDNTLKSVVALKNSHRTLQWGYFSDAGIYAKSKLWNKKFLLLINFQNKKFHNKVGKR